MVLLMAIFALLLQAAGRPVPYPGPADHATSVPAPVPSIDPNRASMAELDLLPGIGRGLARRIILHRQASGAFQSAADLERVPGIGPILLQRIRPQLLFAPDAARTDDS